MEGLAFLKRAVDHGFSGLAAGVPAIMCHSGSDPRSRLLDAVGSQRARWPARRVQSPAFDLTDRDRANPSRRCGGTPEARRFGRPTQGLALPKGRMGRLWTGSPAEAGSLVLPGGGESLAPVIATGRDPSRTQRRRADADRLLRRRVASALHESVALQLRATGKSRPLRYASLMLSASYPTTSGLSGTSYRVVIGRSADAAG